MIEQDVQIFKDLSNSDNIRILKTLIGQALKEFQDKHNVRIPKITLLFDEKRTMITWKDVDTKELIKESLGFSPLFFNELNSQFQIIKSKPPQNQMAGVVMTTFVYANSQFKLKDLCSEDYKRPDLVITHFLQDEIANKFKASRQMIHELERKKLLKRAAVNKQPLSPHNTVL